MSLLAPSRPVVRPPNDLPRRRFSVGDVERMIANGVIADDERLELLGGEIVAMAAKGNRHEIVRSELSYVWSRSAPDDVMVVSETPLRLADDERPEPDVIVFPMRLDLPDLRGPDVMLVVEVADHSLGYDLGYKSLLYAAYGVAEYWVIDVNALVTHVHRAAGPQGYSDIARHARTTTLAAGSVPGLTLCLDQMKLEW